MMFRNYTDNTSISTLKRTTLSSHEHTALSLCVRTCMDLQATALTVEKRRGAIFLQQRVRRSWGAVLLPEGKADLWDKGLGSSQTSTGTCRGLCWRGRFGGVCCYRSHVVLCFVFSLERKKKEFG